MQKEREHPSRFLSGTNTLFSLEASLLNRLNLVFFSLVIIEKSIEKSTEESNALNLKSLQKGMLNNTTLYEIQGIIVGSFREVRSKDNHELMMKVRQYTGIMKSYIESNDCDDVDI